MGVSQVVLALVPLPLAVQVQEAPACGRRVLLPGAPAAGGQRPRAVPGWSGHRHPVGRGWRTSAHSLGPHPGLRPAQAVAGERRGPGRGAVDAVDSHRPVLVPGPVDVGVRTRAQPRPGLSPEQKDRRSAVGPEQGQLHQHLSRTGDVPSLTDGGRPWSRHCVFPRGL